jgi:SAM-dependent methyltransferase
MVPQQLPPEPAHDLRIVLGQQEREWNRRPLVRRQYLTFYRRIVAHLSPIPLPTVELGSGIGRFKQVKPDAVMTDIAQTPWSDEVVDAHELPYATGSVGNLVLLDVFHHLGDPARFLDEAKRVLAPSGRVVIIDPYCSALSTLVYRRFHHERTDLSVDPFEYDVATSAAPLESNQARATLVFYRRRGDYIRRFPELPIVVAERFALLVYPLTGGFSGRRLLPQLLYRPLEIVEHLVRPFAPVLAFRCLVVLQREAAG